jgi:hypothetical protein
MARPIPWRPPVTIAVFPVSRGIFMSSNLFAPFTLREPMRIAQIIYYQNAALIAPSAINRAALAPELS